MPSLARFRKQHTDLLPKSSTAGPVSLWEQDWTYEFDYQIDLEVNFSILLGRIFQVASLL